MEQEGCVELLNFAETGVVRKPSVAEMAEVQALVEKAAQAGAVLPRTEEEYYEHLRDFLVYADEHGVGGCCALHLDMATLAEIRSLVVRPDLRGAGVGRKLLEACMEEARALGIARVYALTRVPALFVKLGFHEVDKRELPHQVYKDCVRCPLFPGCDESAMVRDLPVETPAHDAN